MSGATFRDWQHASRLYVNENFKHAPKTKFLYHVTFYLSERARQMVPGATQHLHEIGMLVKSADLPRYTANTTVLNKYNRKKVVQSNIEYNPVTVILYDDNYGATRQLLEGYYKYYFIDGVHEPDSGAFGNSSSGDTVYKGASYNGYKFGMDNNIDVNPYFEKIEIAQLARGEYYRYTLVRPLLTDWSHDTVESSSNGDTMENKITVAYEAVYYDQGQISGEEPGGFSRSSHYDRYCG